MIIIIIFFMNSFDFWILQIEKKIILLPFIL